ncbi:MAG TPA: hypothetical protein DCZ94_03115 [Lentisphaeria bacterium]|nr:MAG: hypothetical protein A2X48_15935 [Lentisphaerae bacterium GWF2_49_21]HBC85924.1 hypothetical protein [Lentisphaeria bacterium]
MSDKGLGDEWHKVETTFRPDILGRLCIVIFRDGRLIGIPDKQEPDLHEELLKVSEEELAIKKNPFPKQDYQSEILKILICQWLNRKGPLTLDWLGNAAGCNYRTVVNALESLGNALARRSDRSVELKYFPKDAWEWLLVNSGRSRLTKKYSDRSGQPRSIDSLLGRLAKMQLPYVAVAGVLGARHYYPDIDLIGAPRLDLTVHCPEKYPDIDFIGRLDPALEQEDDPGKPASVVLHFIRRETPFFETNSAGVPWADPVECLLDLHEMRLESQALGFLNALQSRGTSQ